MILSYHSCDKKSNKKFLHRSILSTSKYLCRSFDVVESLNFAATRTDNGRYRCFAENGIADIGMSRVSPVGPTLRKSSYC